MLKVSCCINKLHGHSDNSNLQTEKDKKKEAGKLLDEEVINLLAEALLIGDDILARAGKDFRDTLKHAPKLHPRVCHRDQ